MADTKLTRESRKRLQRRREKIREDDLCEHLECLAAERCLDYQGFNGDSLTRY